MSNNSLKRFIKKTLIHSGTKHLYFLIGHKPSTLDSAVALLETIFTNGAKTDKLTDNIVYNASYLI